MHKNCHIPAANAHPFVYFQGMALGLLDCTASITRVVAPLCAGYVILHSPFGGSHTVGTAATSTTVTADSDAAAQGDVLAPWLMNSMLCVGGALALSQYPRWTQRKCKVPVPTKKAA